MLSTELIYFKYTKHMINIYICIHHQYYTCTYMYVHVCTCVLVYTTNITRVYMYMYAFFMHNRIIKGSFHDSLCLRCVLVETYDVSHAVIHACPKGSFPTISNKKVRDFTAKLLTEVYHDVDISSSFYVSYASYMADSG